MKVWIYEEGKPAERRFKSEEEAQAWFAKNDPEGVAFAVDLPDRQDGQRGTVTQKAANRLRRQ